MSDQGIFDSTAPDATALLAACRQRGTAARRELAEVGEALLTNRPGPLTDRQRAQIGNMLRRLIAQIEAALHGELAPTLEARPDLRREGVAAFCAAPPGGTYERLAEAGVISDPGLIEAALHRMFEHNLELALRPAAADPWNQDSGVLRLRALFADDRTVADRLNRYVVDRTERTDGYGEPVLRCDELDPAVTARLHWLVAAALRDAAAVAAGVAPERLDPEFARATRAVLAACAERAAAPSATAQVVAALAEAGRLDGQLAVDALRQAEVPLFVSLVARLSGLRPTLVRRLTFEPDGLGLAILARAIGLEAELLAATFRLTRHARAPARANGAEEGLRLSRLFERVATDDAMQVSAHWLLPADYLDALWRLGPTRPDSVSNARRH